MVKSYNQLAFTTLGPLAWLLQESPNKRLVYLKGWEAVRLSDWARQQGLATNAQLNVAKRQTIAAFREKGIWKIGAWGVCLCGLVWIIGPCLNSGSFKAPRGS